MTTTQPTPTNDAAWADVPALELAVTPLTSEEVLARISSAVEDERRILLAGHNLHSAYLFHADPEFRDFYQKADIAVLDGWPVLALLNRERRRRGQTPLPSDYRIGSTDWIPAAIELPEVSRVCVVGASEAANSKFIERAQQLAPATVFLGIPGNPWAPEHLDDVATKVDEFSPQLTVIGMGMPLQESIAVELMSRGLGGVVATVGGAIDQLAGEQSHAPRWTGRLRVEWLWRLASSPRRLGHRYLVEPFKLIRLLRAKRGVL
ncbi:MAG TPA: WecB/TagA/CpsF family glycosyltransferase [Microbacterium sp.]|uniref:WecB/TagA/CpsF family glycosyltransferase n=1 Tax=Microbacterium sp. TaxID=51671 RepID=UPI002F94ED80